LRFGQLYAKLRLTPDQVAEFERLIARRNEAMVATGRERILQGLDRNDPGFLARRDAAVTPIDRDLQSLLGDSGYKSYRQFEQTSGVRGLVESLAGAVYYSDAPLTAQQGEQLASVLVATNKRQRGGRPEWMDLDWDATMAETQSILSPAQLAALKALHDQAALQQAAAQHLAKPAGR
jgi:hypothetical protein